MCDSPPINSGTMQFYSPQATMSKYSPRIGTKNAASTMMTNRLPMIPQN